MVRINEKQERLFTQRTPITYVIIFSIIIGIYFYIKFVNSTKDFSQVSFSIPSEYTDLFNDAAKRKLIIYESYISPKRNTISILDYDRFYSIIIYKFSCQRDEILKNILKQDFKGANQSPFSQYLIIKTPNINLTYSLDSISKIKNLITTFYGDSLEKYIHNDSIYNSKFKLKKISFRYDFTSHDDISFESAKPLSDYLPVDLIYIKKKLNIYLMIVSSKTDSLTINKNLFFQLIKTN